MVLKADEISSDGKGEGVFKLKHFTLGVRLAKLPEEYVTFELFLRAIKSSVLAPLRLMLTGSTDETEEEGMVWGGSKLEDFSSAVECIGGN